MNTKEKLKMAQLEYNQLADKLSSIPKRAVRENREMTKQELSDFDDIENDMRIQEHQIKKLTEKMETEKRQASEEAETVTATIPGAYGKNHMDANLSRLILDTYHGKQPGENERELIKLGSEQDRARGIKDTSGLAIPMEYINKAAYSVAGGPAGPIPTSVYTPIDTVIEQSFLDEIGVTRINVAFGDDKILFNTGATSSAPGEGNNLSDGAGTITADTIKPQRYGNYMTLSEEWLTSAVPGSVNQIVNDALASIDRALCNALLDAIKIDTNVIHTDHQVADAAEVPSSAGLFDLVSDLSAVSSFKRPGFVASKQLVYLMAQTGLLSGSVESPMLTPDFKFWKWPVYPTEMLEIHDTTLYDAIFGDWSRAYTAYWGNPRVLIDPYTSAVAGNIRMFWLRMADFSYNPAAFSGARNFDLS